MLCSLFWHSGLRNSFLGTSNFFTYDVLRLRRGTLAARYIGLFFVFGISAAFHTSNDIMLGIAPEESVEHEFFLMQAVGITLEDFAGWVHRVVRSRRRRNRRDEKSGERVETWQKLMGYLWVMSWFVFTTPRWSYQRLRLDADSWSTSGQGDRTPD